MPRGTPDWGRVSARQRFSETVGAVLYEQMITVAANVAVGSPTSQDMVMEKGEAAWIQVRFPAGPAGLLHIAIFDSDGTTQLFPGGSGTWFIGDNEVIEFDTEFKLTTPNGDYKFVLKGYNEDDTYQHSALVRVWVIPYPA